MSWYFDHSFGERRIIFEGSYFASISPAKYYEKYGHQETLKRRQDGVNYKECVDKIFWIDESLQTNNSTHGLGLVSNER